MIQSLHIYGSFYGKGSEHLYTYTTPGVSTPFSVNTYIFDFRSYVENVPQCYALWCTQEGWWISVLAQNTVHDNRRGLVEVAFCLGKNRPKNGADVVRFLDSAINDFVHKKPAYDPILDTTRIENFGPDQNFWSDAETQQWLAAHPLELVPYAQWRSFTLGDMPMPAYRVYNTPEDLASALCFLSQPGYNGACRVLLVSGNDAARVNNSMTCISSPLQRIFTIECSMGVQCNQTEANEGDSLTVTYQRHGFESIIEHVKVGDITRGTVDGTMYTLYPAEQVGLQFKKRVYIVCRDGQGKEITDATVHCNGTKISKDANSGHFYYEYSEYESKVKLQVTHSNYDTVNENVNITGNRQEIPVTLKTKGCNVIFEVGDVPFKAGTVNKGSSEYQALINYGARCVDSTLYVRVSRPNIGAGRGGYVHGPTGGGSTGDEKESSWRENLPEWFNAFLKGGAIAGAVIAVIYILYALGCFLETNHAPWPFYKPVTDTIVTPPPPSPGDEEGGTPTDTLQVQFEQDDIAYLKKCNTWKKSDLKSDKYKTLMDYIANGQIDEILAQVWFKNNPENGFWTAIVRDLTKIKDSGNTKDFESAAKIVRENSGKGENVTLSYMNKQIGRLATYVTASNLNSCGSGSGTGSGSGHGSGSGSGHGSGSGSGSGTDGGDVRNNL